MPNSIVQQYIGRLKEAGKPYITTETQVSCERVVLTAAPNIDAEVVHLLRVDFPADLTPSDSPYWLLFLVSVFGAQTFCDIQPRIAPAVIATGEFSETINGWRLRMFTEDGHRVCSVAATSPAST